MTSPLSYEDVALPREGGDDLGASGRQGGADRRSPKRAAPAKRQLRPQTSVRGRAQGSCRRSLHALTALATASRRERRADKTPLLAPPLKSSAASEDGGGASDFFSERWAFCIVSANAGGEKIHEAECGPEE